MVGVVVRVLRVDGDVREGRWRDKRFKRGKKVVKTDIARMNKEKRRIGNFNCFRGKCDGAIN